MKIAKPSKAVNRTASWAQLRQLLPSVHRPLFHKTTGVRASQIFSDGIRVSESARSNSEQVGISFTRSLDWAEHPYIGGTYIFVIDQDDFPRGAFQPYQHSMVGDEYEERYTGNYVPLDKIHAVLSLYPMGRSELRNLPDLQFPIFERAQNGKWRPVQQEKTAMTSYIRYRGRLYRRADQLDNEGDFDQQHLQQLKDRRDFRLDPTNPASKDSRPVLQYTPEPRLSPEQFRRK